MKDDAIPELVIDNDAYRRRKHSIATQTVPSVSLLEVPSVGVNPFQGLVLNMGAQQKGSESGLLCVSFIYVPLCCASTDFVVSFASVLCFDTFSYLFRMPSLMLTNKMSFDQCSFADSSLHKKTLTKMHISSMSSASVARRMLALTGDSSSSYAVVHFVYYKLLYDLMRT